MASNKHLTNGLQSFTALLIYIDDILIIGNDSASIDALKKFSHSHFRIKYLGDIKYFLGIEVSFSRSSATGGGTLSLLPS